MRATTRRTSHELLLPRVWRGHRPLLSLRQTDGGFWNSRGERQITRLKKLTMTEGTGGSKLCRGWMNDVTTKAKATLMRCSMQSSLYNTFLSARKSSTAHSLWSCEKNSLFSSQHPHHSSCLSAVCVHAMTTTSHNRAGRGDADPAPVENPCQSAAPAPDPPSASANVLADMGRQPFNGLFHVWEESRPGLTLALLGQTGGRQSQVANTSGKMISLPLVLI